MKYYLCQNCGMDFEDNNPNECPFCNANRTSLVEEAIGGVEYLDYSYCEETTPEYDDED